MSDKSQALAIALLSALTTALGSTPVYDAVPPSVDHSAAFCYVTLNDIQALDWSTKTFDGQDFAVNIHVWSSYRGNKEVQEKFSTIHAALHKTPSALTVSGATVVECLYEASQIFLDPDGLTRHGVQRFRVLVQHT